MTELLEPMDCAFSDVREYDTMICSLYEIWHKDGDSTEEYMLRIHEAVVVICHSYPRQVADQGKNLRDALEFMMAKLPEREQAGASFDTLYMLANKMEAHQPNHIHQGQGSSDSYQDRYRRYPAPAGWMTMLANEELLPSDPEPLEQGVLEPDVIDGLSLRMTQATRGRNSTVLCVEQLITLLRIVLIGSLSACGGRSN